MHSFTIAEERRFAWSGLGVDEWRWVQGALWRLWVMLSPVGRQRGEVERLVEVLATGERRLTAAEAELARRAVAALITDTRAGDKRQVEWMKIHNELAAVSFRFYKVYSPGCEPKPVPGSTEHW